VFLQTFDIESDGLSYVLERDLPSRPIGNAARQRRNSGHVDTILVSLDQDSVFHWGWRCVGRCSYPDEVLWFGGSG
jgi:hypothetical protein